MTSIDDLLAEVTARQKTVRVLLRQDLLVEHARLDAELIACLKVDEMENRDPLGPGLAERLVELEAEIDAARRPFHFRAIGKKAWADLLALHPPTKEQKAADSRVDHNLESFPLAAIAASCVDPVMTVEQVAKLESVITVAQFDVLWAGCLDANVGGGDSSGPKSYIAGPIARAREALERSVTGMDDPSPALSSSVG